MCVAYRGIHEAWVTLSKPLINLYFSKKRNQGTGTKTNIWMFQKKGESEAEAIHFKTLY